MSQSQLSIIVNDVPRTVPQGTNVEGLLDLLGLKPRFLAVELNRQVVPRSDHRQTVLSEGDCIEIVTLVGGG
jgi:sulfur carrier protein